MNLLYLVAVGFAAGWLAGRFMKGSGYGIMLDIVLGMLGGVFGGWTFGALGIWPGGGIVPAILVGFVGAVALVWLTRQIKKI
jgi:uncharacterized membrane protein YeaQ/YmgE (transglycosylase-associated protein family)